MTQANDNSTKQISRIAELCVSGQIAAAELELHEFCRQPGCTSTARVVLSALLARRGECENALVVLSDHTDDPQELLSFLCLSLQQQSNQSELRRLVRSLHERHGHLPWVRRLLAVMQPPGIETLAMTAGSSVEQLSGELSAQPDIIRSLVVAQQLDPDPLQIDMLRRSVARIAPQYEHDRRLVMMCQAMAELSLLVEDNDEARRWSHRGLKIDPYCAALALVLAKIDDDPAVGPPAHEVLEQVSHKHPTYPDVRAALIRRELQAGRSDDARLRLAKWLEHEPDSRIAQKVSEELGAAA